MLSGTFCLFFLCFGFLCGAQLAVGNQRPYFDSRNFHNVLRWNHTRPTRGQEPVLYSVMYRSFRDGEPVRAQSRCQNISARSCDLTAETPPLPDRYYEALLYAQGTLLGKTYRFLPIAQTVLGAPLLSTRVSGSSLSLDVVLPAGPGGVSLLDLLNRSRRFTLEPPVSYTLRITQPPWAEQVTHSLAPRYALQLKNNDTTYCGVVEYRPTVHIGRPPSHNATFCVLMPRDRGAGLPWVLVASGLAMVPLVLGAVLVYVYTHPRTKPRLPVAMQVVSSRPRLLGSPDLSYVHSVAEVRPPQEQKPLPRLRPTPVPADPGGYSPQGEGPTSPPSPSASGGEQRSRCQSSVSYGNVTFNPDREDPPPGTDPQGPQRTPPRAGPLADPGARPTAGPRVLLVPTVRNREGQLVLSLPPPAFPWQAGGGEEEQEEQEEEKGRLLVGVGYQAQGPPPLPSLGEVGGSEEQSFSPDRLWVSSPGREGGYKPNSFSLGGGAAPWPWPGEEEEEEEEEQGDRQLFLKDWDLHVQE